MSQLSCSLSKINYLVRKLLFPARWYPLTNIRIDLFDNMYELTDSLTFKLRSISPTMWPVFELTYKMFKAEAVDFLEG